MAVDCVAQFEFPQRLGAWQNAGSSTKQLVPPLRVNRRRSLPQITEVVFVLFFILSLPTIAWSQAKNADQTDPIEYAQQSPTSQNNAAPAPALDSGAVSLPDAASAPQDKKDNSQGKQTKRMFGVVPNFAAVSANTQLPPLSTREKFSLAAHDSILDYSSFHLDRNLSCSSLAPEFQSGTGQRIRRLQALLLAHLHGRSVGNLFHRGHCARDHTRGPALLHSGSGKLFSPHRLRDISGLRR